MHSAHVTTSLAARAAARRLIDAAARREPCAPVRDLIGADDVRLAYEVQQLVTRTRQEAGARPVGRKIGLTAPAVQAQLSVDQPDFGMLFDDMDASDGHIGMAGLLQPRAEAEVAFVLADDLDDPQLDLTAVRRAIAHAVAAIEVVDSRIAGWDITFGDTVADNASSGRFVLGGSRRELDGFVPASVAMEMTLDGQVVSTGSGAECLGDPLHAVLWLARKARDLEDPLRAGEIILSGALGPMVPVRAGSVVTARISGLGSVSATFVAASKEQS